MDRPDLFLLGGLGLVFAAILLLLLRRPLGRLLGLALRTSGWLAVLAACRHVLPASVMVLGVNWVNALVLGLLGLPGLGLLFIVNWLLTAA